MPSIAQSLLVGFIRSRTVANFNDSDSGVHRAVTGAFFNGVFLIALALSIFLQSVERFVKLEVVESPVLVLIIGGIGLALNIISVFVVHGKASMHDVNVVIYPSTDHGGHGHDHGTNTVELAVKEAPDVIRARDGIV